MKKLILLLCSTILFAGTTLYSQDDSAYYSRLYYTCKTWGLVKYFHSELAVCSLDWDSVLIAKLPEIKAAASNPAFNDILLDMVNSPGETALPTTTLPYVPDSLMYNLNTDWFDDEALSDAVATALDTISSRFRPRPHCQVGQAFYNGNPTFTNDQQYYNTSGTYPDEELRLLALFRYWNIINYFFPYKNIMDQNWDETLAAVIPLFVEAGNATDYNLAMLKLTHWINDSHAYTGGGVINSIFGIYYPRFMFVFVEDETVIYKVDNSITDIKPGDIIRAIDGCEISALRDSLSQYARGSNDLAVSSYVNNYILTGPSGSFDITVEDETGIHTHTFTRDWNNTTFNNFMANTGPVWYDTLVNESCLIGYVDMGRLTTSEVEGMMDDLWETDAIIIDIRNYPQGTLWTLVNYLFPEPIHIANFTVPNKNYPGVLFWSEETIGSINSDVYQGQLLILFDIRTISQAEYTVMGLEQHPGSIKIGSTTKAADGNVSQVFLPGNLFTYFTGLGTFYADYTPTQRVGIIPDIELWPTIEGLGQEKDEVLDYALNCLLLEKEEIETDPQVTSITLQPNPVSETTILSYHLTSPSECVLEVIDITGQRIITIRCGKQDAGDHQLVIEGKDLSPGIYFCVLSLGDGVRIAKMVKH